MGIGSIALWRAYTGTAPETDRAVAIRQLQARTAQASEQLVEKTKGLEATQQESIDQLQVVQDQLQTVRRLLASQQTDTKKLSEQVGTLTEAIDGLRQSFASARASEARPPSPRPANGRPRQSRARSEAPTATAASRRLARIHLRILCGAGCAEKLRGRTSARTACPVSMAGIPSAAAPQVGALRVNWT